MRNTRKTKPTIEALIEVKPRERRAIRAVKPVVYLCYWIVIGLFLLVVV